MLVATFAAPVVAGCGQQSDPPAVGPGVAAAVKAATPAPKVVAKLTTRERTIGRIVTKSRLEVAKIVADSKREHRQLHRPSLATVKRLATAAIAQRKKFTGLAQVSACVDRARARLLRSLGRRAPSAAQIRSLLQHCMFGTTAPMSRPRRGRG